MVRIEGVAYVPLFTLCDQRGVAYDYDSFGQTIDLLRDEHRISLRVHDSLVLVDGTPQHLPAPVLMHEGAVVVPDVFSSRVLDGLVKGGAPIRRTLVGSPIKKIIIDAGHGGIDPGAIGKNGLKEKDVNLDIAKRLATLLKAQGVGVVMTRDHDIFKPLPTRVKIANDANADLFVSIHSNANRVRSLKGFEVYCISPSSSDYKRAQNAVDDSILPYEQDCLGSPSRTLKMILWDMVYTYNRAESIQLARSVCSSIRKDIDVPILGVKGANFFVLKGTNMPAVLIEIGFVSNSNEERLLRNSYYRQQLAEAICTGIAEYATTVVAEAGK